MKHHLFSLCIVLALLPACRRTLSPETEPAEEQHPFSEAEQVKKHLDEAFAEFYQAVPVFETTDEATAFLLSHSAVLPLGKGTYYYWLVQQNAETGQREVLVEMTFKVTGLPQKLYLDTSLLGGLQLRGNVLLLEFTQDPATWDKALDIDLLDGGKAVARLGVEVLYYKESGREETRPLVVFRFPDGTSYSVSSLLLIEPLVDYILMYVLGTL